MRICTVFVCLLVALCFSGTARAQLTEFDWTGSVDSNWHVNGNWSSAQIPNAGNHSASVVSATNLSIDLGSSDTRVAELILNGTSSSAAVNIASSGGGRLILQNDDDNTYFTNADPEVVPWLNVPGVNDGRVLIRSLGPTGATNEISAPVIVNNSGFLEGLDFYGDRDLVLSGGLSVAGTPVPEPVFWAPDQLRTQVRNFMSDNQVTISGSVVLNDGLTGGTARSLGINNFYTTDHGSVDDGDFPDDERLPPRGTVEISGDISGGGGLTVGWEWAPRSEQTEFNADPAPGPSIPRSTVILSGNNTFTGDISLSQVNLVLRADHALGIGGSIEPVADLQGGNKVGQNIVVDAGDVTIANPIIVNNNITFKGSASLTSEGVIYQTAGRELINLLDDGETLTLSGPMFANTETDAPSGPTPSPGRTLTIDGSGRTLVAGGIHDTFENDPINALEFVGSFRKRGSGTVIIDFDEAKNGLSDTPTDYRGYTYMEGGNLHFATASDVPVPGAVENDSGEILSHGGAIGVDDGVLENSQFLGLLNNSSNPNHSPPTSPSWFRHYSGDFGSRIVVWNRYDSGGLMLGTDEYDQDLNFDSGDLANAANMTLAAHETDSEYTGTITPSSTIIRDANTYQLGGGAGTLTLPNTNQLVDNGGTPRNLSVRNGGEVVLGSTNSYSGKTKIQGNWDDGLSIAAAQVEPGVDVVEDDVTIIPATGDRDDSYYRNTTLTVSDLTDGNSSLGTSTAAGDLLVQGSTLKYVGSAVDTNRVLTIGTAGGTIDASGSGALRWTNTGALEIDVAEDREGVALQGVPGNQNNEIFGIPSYSGNDGPVVFNTDDLVPGMRISVSSTEETTVDPLNLNGTQHAGIGDDLVVTEVRAPDVIAIGEDQVDDGETPWENSSRGFSTNYLHVRWNFGPAPARMIKLTGTNTDDNTIAASISDASDRDEVGGDGGPGGRGSVGITKSGPGKWLLSNANNDYTGDTIVQQGTLGGLSIGSGNLIVQDGGTIAPGLSTHTLAVGGDFTLEEGGALEIEINSLSDFDVLDVAGSALLEGSLKVLLGFTPATNDTFTVATAASITNLATLLDDLTLTGSGSQFDFSASTATELILTFTGSGGGLPGDYNNDGFVDAADYTVWRDHLNDPTEAAINNNGNGTGGVDAADYAWWKTHFGNTSGSGAVANTQVPEPTTLGLLFLAIALLGVGRRPDVSDATRSL